MSKAPDAPRMLRGLSDPFPFRRRAIVAEGRLIHFVDDGVGPAALLIHGNSSWSYTFRHVISRLKAEGFRVIAPDLFGFGLSEKPRSWRSHTFVAHSHTLSDFLEQLALSRILFVGHGIGASVALDACRRNSENLSSAVFINADLAQREENRSNVNAYSPPLLFNAKHWSNGEPRPGNLRDWMATKGQHLLSKRERAGVRGLSRIAPDKSTRTLVSSYVKAQDANLTMIWGRHARTTRPQSKREHQNLFPSARIVESTGGDFVHESAPALITSEVVRSARNPAPPPIDRW